MCQLCLVRGIRVGMILTFPTGSTMKSSSSSLSTDLARLDEYITSSDLSLGNFRDTSCGRREVQQIVIVHSKGRWIRPTRRYYTATGEHLPRVTRQQTDGVDICCVRIVPGSYLKLGAYLTTEAHDAGEEEEGA